MPKQNISLFNTNTSLSYLVPFRKRHYWVYTLILLLVISCVAVLPLVSISISTKAQGIVRPQRERTEVKNSITGIIAQINYKEGDTVSKGAVILSLKDKITPAKTRLNNYEMTQTSAFIQDLNLLTGSALNDSLFGKLSTPLYQQQLSQYLVTVLKQNADLRKTAKELNINQQLLKGKVISPKEFFDTKIAYDKAIATAQSLQRAQISTWQQDLVKYQQALSQYQQQQSLVNSDAVFYQIKAPVSGTVQHINTQYAGGTLQAGETICSISPNDSIIAECYVSTKDIGLIKIGQPVVFQIDAFDYNYFGTLNGKVSSISNDFITQQQGQQPVFIVRCTFDNTRLKLKNGYHNSLKKGLTFQARFVIGNRTLWQLLWDNVNDWLNPNSPQMMQTTAQS